MGVEGLVSDLTSLCARFGQLYSRMETPHAEGSKIRTKPHVRNFSARNSGAGNGCANFMGAWDFWVLSAGNPPMPIKFLV